MVEWLPGFMCNDDRAWQVAAMFGDTMKRPRTVHFVATYLGAGSRELDRIRQGLMVMLDDIAEVPIDESIRLTETELTTVAKALRDRAKAFVVQHGTLDEQV